MSELPVASGGSSQASTVLPKINLCNGGILVGRSGGREHPHLSLRRERPYDSPQNYYDNYHDYHDHQGDGALYGHGTGRHAPAPPVEAGSGMETRTAWPLADRDGSDHYSARDPGVDLHAALAGPQRIRTGTRG